jgi:hypothetical protein
MPRRKHRERPPAAVAHIDALLDEALKETFPASDAVAIDIERGFGKREVPDSSAVLGDGQQ